MIERARVTAGLGIKAHAHMLRHACGYKLANDGHDTLAIQAYLGHRNIQNTTRYTALVPQRFEEFFRDWRMGLFAEGPITQVRNAENSPVYPAIDLVTSGRMWD
jgi:hypothetical protein